MSAFFSRALFWKVLVVASLFAGLAMAKPEVKIKDLGKSREQGPMPSGSLLSGLDWEEPAPMPRGEMLAAAGWKLPTTWDYVAGFTKGGMDALNAVQTLRGNRAWSPRRGRRYRQSYGPHTTHYYGSRYYSPPYDPDPPHHRPFDPDPWPHYAPPGNPMPPSNTIPSNPPPAFGPQIGEIRRIDGQFDPDRASAIVNPGSTNRTLRYLLDGEPVDLPPGHYQTLGTGRSWKIEFDRGGSFGQQRYSIGNGVYTFNPTARGWELVRRPK